MRIFTSIALFFVLCSTVWSATTEIKPLNAIKGSVADAALQKNCPEFIADPLAMKELWQYWKLKEKVPEVDFFKHIVLVSTTVGSVINLSVALDENGDMKTVGMSSMDFGEGFRYMMLVVSREGVKTVNGKKVPTSWKVIPIASYKGSVNADEFMALNSEVITNLQAFKDLWKTCKLTDKLPEVDFSKQIVVTNTTIGSIIYPSYSIDINGNLTVAAISTKDIAPGFRFQIAVISRDGVKKVNGKDLPAVVK